MRKRDRDTRKKKLRREKRLIDHKINQGCPRWFSLKTLFALLSYDAVVAAAVAAAAAAACRGASG